MKNSKLRKALLLAACAVMLVCLSVGATLAYLTSATDVVSNTFVVGEGITIDLDEAPVYAPGEEPTREQFGKEITAAEGEETPERVKANDYKIVPNWTYDKDPTVTVETGSGKCYVFVKVVNGLAAAEIETSTDEAKTIEDQMTANGWLPLSGETDVYYYAKPATGTALDNAGTVVDAGSAEVKLVVFENFTTKNYETLTEAGLTSGGSVTISVDAYAIQADGFENAAEAWEAGEHTFGQNEQTPTNGDNTTGDDTTGGNTDDTTGA